MVFFVKTLMKGRWYGNKIKEPLYFLYTENSKETRHLSNDQRISNDYKYIFVLLL